MTIDAHVVRVLRDDRTHQLWIAATPRSEAVDRVLDAVPEGWTARLGYDDLQEREDLIAELAPGEVRALSEAARSR